MRALILSYGSRGDVQPFVALARSLMLAGHDVILATPHDSAPLAESYGINTFGFKDRTKELLENPRYHRSVRNRYRGTEYLTDALRRTGHILSGALDEVAEVGKQDADIVVHNHAIHGHQIAERLRVPAVAVDPLPALVPTRAFPNPMFPISVPRMLNRTTYRWTPLMSRGVFGPTARWRRETLKLPWRRGYTNPIRNPDGTPATVLHPFSPRLLPAPPNYPSSVHTTGYWFLPAPPTWAPPRRLSDFLAAGDPPVYLGFGSLANTSPERTGQIVAEAVRLAGVRALVVAGTGHGIQVDARREDMLALDEVPFDWLFPRMAAVVQHGGVGTTGAALAAGRPQIVCPFIPSQRFIARRLIGEGVAAAMIEQHELTPEDLAEAIQRAATDDVIAARAKDIASEVRNEDGAATAIDILEGIGAVAHT